MITLTPKDEDYLETIYRISRDFDTVGVTDIARARNVTVPTARTAVGRLIRYGLVRQQHYGKIMLNADGEKMGEQIYSVHSTLRRFLSDVLLLEADEADAEACRMEHGLSRGTLKRLTLFLDAVHGCGGGASGCLGRYRNQLDRNSRD